MLIKVKRLIIENEGYRRKIYSTSVVINSRNIISIVDYDGVQNFLLKENPDFANRKYCLLKISLGQQVEDMILEGTTDSILSLYEEQNKKEKILLND